MFQGLIIVLEDGFFHLWTKLLADKTSFRPVQAVLHVEIRKLSASTLSKIMRNGYIVYDEVAVSIILHRVDMLIMRN